MAVVGMVAGERDEENQIASGQISDGVNDGRTRGMEACSAKYLNNWRT